eukprot:6042415-Amphidinium_carterae.1
MLRTFCGCGLDFTSSPQEVPQDIQIKERVETMLLQEWRKVHAWITEKHCKDAALCISETLSHDPHARPSFDEIAEEMRRLRPLVARLQ